MNNIENEALAYIRTLFEGNADGHGYDHSYRVYLNAIRIAMSETGCDPQIIALAAILHDTDDYKLFSTVNNASARAFLNAHNIPQQTIERICEAINSVSFQKNQGKKPETLEGQIVQDADRLDAIGAIGIARTFAFGGSHGRPPEESIQHFHEKLLLLKDLMNTESARKMAESRHTFMVEFLQEWAAETAGAEEDDDGLYS